MTEDREKNHMDHSQPLSEACPIGSALDVLGQKWTLLIIREAVKGARRFSEFEQALGCPRNLLSARLRLLRDRGILRVVPYEIPGQRAREHYELTPAGRELAPTLVTLFDWGMKHTSAEGASWTEPRLRCSCGAKIHAALECDGGHHITAVDELTFPEALS